MNIDNGRDAGSAFWVNTDQPLAAAVTRSPLFRCQDPPGGGGLSAGQTRPIVDVRGPGVDVFIIIPTASVGANVSLTAYDATGTALATLWTAATAAAATYNLATLLAAAMAAAPKTYNSPAPIWQAQFTNGASNQASAITFLVRAGGWT